jgi:hypothetical protein
MLAGLAAVPLAGCAAPMATVEPSVPPAIEPMSHASRADGPFTCPACPTTASPAGCTAS